MTALLSLWWLTPIVWSLEMIPSSLRSIFELNPIYYVIEGYRSFKTGVPFSAHGMEAKRFWSITLVVLLIGAYVFKRLKAEFADVL